MVGLEVHRELARGYDFREISTIGEAQFMTTKPARKWKALEAEFIKLEELGNSIEGILNKKSPVNYKVGPPGEKYELVGEDGKAVTVLGTVELIDKMVNVPLGAFIHIELTGMVDTGQPTPMKTYLVLTEDPEGDDIADIRKAVAAAATSA